MIVYNKIITFTIIFLFISFWGNAQKFVGDIRINDKEQTHVIFFKNGNKEEGRIISIENTELTFMSTKEESPKKYHLSDLNKIMVKGAKENKFEKYDDLSERGLNRLFYQETGFSLRAGEVQYSTHWGIIHKIDYAITDGFTIGTGMIYPGYFIFQSKINMADRNRRGRMKLGLNLDLAARPSREFDDFLEKEVTRWRGFMRLGLFTSYGKPNRNIHIALNINQLFNDEDTFGDGGIVSFNFGGTFRVAKHWRVIYENTLAALETNFNFDQGLFTAIGIAWFDKKNVIKVGVQPSFKFGFFNYPLTDINTMHQLPNLSYSRNF